MVTLLVGSSIRDGRAIGLGIGVVLGLVGVGLLFEHETVSFWVTGRTHPVPDT